jgi:ketosteroid isomerase-like protein
MPTFILASDQRAAMNHDVQTIIELSHAIVEIERRKDAGALERHIADDYAGVEPSGALINKEISVGRFRDPGFILDEHGIYDVSVTMLGDVALDIGVMAMKGRLGTFEFGGRYRYTHTWLRMAEGWKVRASQLTPIIRD